MTYRVNKSSHQTNTRSHTCVIAKIPFASSKEEKTAVLSCLFCVLISTEQEKKKDNPRSCISRCQQTLNVLLTACKVAIIDKIATWLGNARMDSGTFPCLWNLLALQISYKYKVDIKLHIMIFFPCLPGL